jgi:hypothetical protein
MLRFPVIALLLFAVIETAKADISESMCQSYMAVVEQAVNLRESSVPIATARSMADSALSLNPQLWRFLIKAINTTYSEPERIKNMLRDGSLVQMCAKEVRGF